MSIIGRETGSGVIVNTPSSPKKKGNLFTLIELLVDTVISSLRFFKRGDKLEVQNTPLFLSGKRAASEVSRPSRWSGLIESLKNTPLFLKRGE
ncbi:MAG: hypothetical protein E7042_06625, partial [Lentisphaerae bacterium]|nr:hypothetical protein [Lentisphaerota bacterium]